MPLGYHNKILHADLSTGKLEIEHPGEEFYRTYMGGSALGLYYLLRDTAPGIDPLGPENVLVLALSVLTGAPISGQSRMTAVAKSPLTDAVGDSQSGGFFPAEMKFAGFDAIVIKGRAEKPVYLWVHDGEAELRSRSIGRAQLASSRGPLGVVVFCSVIGLRPYSRYWPADIALMAAVSVSKTRMASFSLVSSKMCL